MSEPAPSVFATTKASPVAQSVRNHTSKASSEFSSLAASRRTPENPAATGQPLTHYHSFFNELLSWKNPRASAVSFISIVTFILAARYLDATRWVLRLTWMTLGVTVAAELAGKLVLGNGLASQLRPRKYTTVSRETIDILVGDFHELINFVVIEAQRILYVENVSVSVAAAFSAFIGYHLTKLVPYWGLALISTVLAFTLPLVYITNQELIDGQLQNASDIVNAQYAQARSIAQKHASNVTALGKQYAGDSISKVQDLIRSRTGGAAKSAPVPSFPTAPTEEPEKVDLQAPDVPTEEPVAEAKQEEPLI
ncbi:Reticulon [Geosmithia morbida]|uniref:Reticulon-like protein n=1 Tax=Geosmithia morbida TaxID=1094350 RepID=A0A9P4Z3J8_9HYPO|nr:Reticulon [Geosmithia morbida]KAF4126789.1 Reticulon [Geosmithia morbida]